MNAKKLKLDEAGPKELSATVEESETPATGDFFTKRFSYLLSNKEAEQLKLPKQQRIERKCDVGVLGPVTEYVGADDEVRVQKCNVVSSFERSYPSLFSL